MKLGEWKNPGTVYFQDELAVLLRSTIKCEYGGVDITIWDCGQRNEINNLDTTGLSVPHFTPIEYVSGYFYTKEGKYLGKIDLSQDVCITDEATFLDIQKKKTVEKSKIIFFTENNKLNNTEFLNRANWVFGEGGSAFADRYAMTIKNLRLVGRSGYGPKAFELDEAMYIKKMSHGKPAKTLYPDYLNGTYKVTMLKLLQ